MEYLNRSGPETDRLFFGGEAFHPRWSGYMQGHWLSCLNRWSLSNKLLDIQQHNISYSYLPPRNAGRCCFDAKGAIGSGEDTAEAILQFLGPKQEDARSEKKNRSRADADKLMVAVKWEMPSRNS